MITMQVEPYHAAISHGRGAIYVDGKPALSISEPTTERALTKAFRIMQAAKSYHGNHPDSTPRAAMIFAIIASTFTEALKGNRYWQL